MKILYALCFAVIVCIQADNSNGFLENIYDELHALNLTSDQEKALKAAIKEHHKFLRQWYIDTKKNNDEILKSFANSSLDKQSIELMQDSRLSEEKTKMEQDFIINVYNILTEEQRKKFGENINKENNIKQMDNINNVNNINNNINFNFKKQEGY